MSTTTSGSVTSRRQAGRCDALALLECLRASARWLEAHAERINALNVFPVPDGDTGTNMSLTMRAAVQAAEEQEAQRVGDLARLAAHGALLGARGNSGVILSQLLRGFAQGVAECEVLREADLARGLGEAARVAYRGVSRPVEGTLLTVAREVAEAAEAGLKLGHDVTQLLGDCVRAAEAAVARTPQQLDVLRRAGVVDAGGEGYRVLLEGAWLYLTGQKMEVAAAVQPGQVLARAREADETPFGFCTELVLAAPRASTWLIREAMERLGQSVIVVGDESLVRVHVHAQRPGQVLEFAVDHGIVQQIKIENMELQHRRYVSTHSQREGLSRIGVIAVAAGDGFKELLTSLGAAAVVEGGQTMNPSVQEILAAVNGAPYEELVILPNNRNIILSASHVRGLTARAVEVVPTLNLVQGVAALMAFNYQEELAANVARMTEAAARVRSVEITTAIRDAQMDGLEVRRGQFLALLDDRLSGCGGDPAELAERTLRLAGAEQAELVTVYYGQDVSRAEAERLLEHLQQALRGPQWELMRGGQPHYQYVISVE